MQNSNYMKLTDNERAIIQKMDVEKCTDLLHECAERLGLVSVNEYSKIMAQNKRTVYDHIVNRKIQSIEFCDSKLIIINN